MDELIAWVSFSIQEPEHVIDPMRLVEEGLTDRLLEAVGHRNRETARITLHLPAGADARRGQEILDCASFLSMIRQKAK